MSIERVERVTPALKDAMALLIPQLSRSSGPMSDEALERFIAQPNVHLFVFRSDDTHDGPILGMLSLATFEIPTGVRAWIEDVVVDSTARGQGAGQALVEAAVNYAEQIGARTVDLTSRPSREAANRLYRRAGFQQRETNVYRYAKPQ